METETFWTRSSRDFFHNFAISYWFKNSDGGFQDVASQFTLLENIGREGLKAMFWKAKSVLAGSWYKIIEMSSASSEVFFSESNKKGEVSELQKNLQSPEVQRDAKQYRKVVRKVIAYMTLGMDVSPLFMDMIKVKVIINIFLLFRCKNIYFWK